MNIDTIEDFAKAALTEPDSFYTSAEYAYTTHGRWLSRHRDSDVLGVSNWVTIQNDMVDRFPDDVEVMGSSHWAVGWCDELFVRVRDDEGNFTPAFEAYYEWYEKLASYPVADEDDLCEREAADVRDTLKSCYDVPEDKVEQVARNLFDDHDVTRSEDFRDNDVYEAMADAGMTDEDIPDWLVRSHEEARAKAEAPREYLEGAAHIRMGTLTPQGIVNEKIVDANICPHLILLPDHYNDDGPCKCYDESAIEMMHLGYRWKDGMWR